MFSKLIRHDAALFTISVFYKSGSCVLIYCKIASVNSQPTIDRLLVDKLTSSWLRVLASWSIVGHHFTAYMPTVGRWCSDKSDKSVCRCSVNRSLTNSCPTHGEIRWASQQESAQTIYWAMFVTISKCGWILRSLLVLVKCSFGSELVIIITKLMIIYTTFGSQLYSQRTDK